MFFLIFFLYFKYRRISAIKLFPPLLFKFFPTVYGGSGHTAATARWKCASSATARRRWKIFAGQAEWIRDDCRSATARHFQVLDAFVLAI